jgi:hypothetical protein
VYKVEVYARVRRAVQVDGRSIRQAAREFGLSRKSIRKMLQFRAASAMYLISRPGFGSELGVPGSVISITPN